MAEEGITFLSTAVSNHRISYNAREVVSVWRDELRSRWDIQYTLLVLVASLEILKGSILGLCSRSLGFARSCYRHFYPVLRIIFQ